MNSKMAAVTGSTLNPNRGGGGPQSIIVSQLPIKLMADLKSLLLGHFANFGRILRISCATKGNRERTAHIQFSSSEEAFLAQQNGRVMNGHRMVITITDRNPTTQILSSAPQPIRCTLASPSENTAQKKDNVQSTLSAYFKQQQSPASSTATKEDKKGLGHHAPTSSTILNEALKAASTSSNSINGAEKTNGAKQMKPKTCVTLEVYQGSSSECQQGTSNTTASGTGAVPTTKQIVSTAGLRPTRSLREILNIDTTNMKVVKTITASDALASQFLTGGRHPFPLSLMFGRIPGSVIMPVGSLLAEIKPGLKISDEAIKLLWNTLLNSVLKKVLARSAKSALRESIVDEMTMKNYNQIENEIVSQEINGAAEKEIGQQEDILIYSEDFVDAMVGLVCTNLIDNASSEELQSSKAISKAVECCFRKLLNVAVKETVHQVMPDAILHNLCEEALEDVLASPIFVRHVKVVAAEALKQCQEERKVLPEEGTGSSSESSTCVRKGVNPIIDSLPSIDSYQLTEHWLLTSPFDLHRQDPREEGLQNHEFDLYSQSSVDTDISCSVGSTESSPQTENSTIMNRNPGTKANSTYNSTAVDCVQEGVFGFGSLKRKAATFLSSFSNLNIFKRPRRENEDASNN